MMARYFYEMEGPDLTGTGDYGTPDRLADFDDYPVDRLPNLRILSAHSFRTPVTGRGLPPR